MADSSTSFRFLQHHLRQAGALLASKELGAASAHIDAALAIDPGSLAALTLRERLAACRAADASRRDTEIPPASNTASSDSTPSRFVPAGVDAASWLDFEKRVQERRFRALLETAERAMGAGNDAAARSALEEARELYPDSGELELLSARVALVSSSVRERPREPLLRSRPLRAAGLLVVGVSLLMGLDWARSDSKSGKVRPSLAGARKSQAGVAVAEGTPAAETLPDPSGSRPTTDVPTVPLANVATELEVPPNVAPVLGGLPTNGELTTSATRRSEPSSSETADEYVARKPLNPREQAVLAPVLTGEIPDDYVAAPRAAAARSLAGDGAAGGGNSAAGGTGPIASVVRQPGPVVDPVGTGRFPTGSPVPAPVTGPPTVAAPAAAAAVVSRSDDELRVDALIRLYTRAYERLDAGAVRAIWPTVDERTLAKAFSGLSSQTLSFDNCAITVNGATARASCHGRASYVVKVGSQAPRTEPRTVQFELRRDADVWKIAKADTRK